MNAKRVYLVRHGETDYNLHHRWQGQLDIPLNATGRDQASKLGDYFHNQKLPIDICYSSDLSRCHETAQLTLQHYTLDIQPEPRLREMHVGIFQGKTRTQLQQELPDAYAQWVADNHYAPPEGESRSTLGERAYAAWQDIIATSPHEHILLVTHGGTLRMMLPKIVGGMIRYTPRFSNTSLTILEREWTANWVVTSAGATPHLL